MRFPLLSGLLLALSLAGCDAALPGDKEDSTSEGTGGKVDVDGDGYSIDDGDCEDENADVNPGASEACNEIDDNCNERIDEGTSAGTWYEDRDGDTFGDPSTGTETCEPPAGTVDNGDDCDDTDAAYNPDAPEDDCEDPNDYNCDGRNLYADNDGDGFAECVDCDDRDDTVNPDEREVCDDKDNDCDGEIDEAGALGTSTWYQDSDSDAYGDASRSTEACDQPAGYVADSTDCDDREANANPGEVEVCDDIDNDCDGDIDEAGALGSGTWYDDADGDGYGDASRSVDACDQPAGYITDNSDCNDRDADINPAAAEVCDSVDNDCDGAVDNNAIDGTTWYADSDGDTYGNAASSRPSCSQPAGYVADDTDCNDRLATAYPGADEVCDSVDNDCDGSVDEDAIDAVLGYEDADGDGFGAPGTEDLRCDGVDNTYDCNDGDTGEPQVADAAASGAEDGSIINPYSTLQDAIDAATQCVVAFAGIYQENVDFAGNGVSVVGVDGAEVTIIEGDGTESVVLFNSGEGADASLSGFTITGGGGHAFTSTTTYDCGSTDDCTDNYVTLCGGALYVDGATPTLHDLVLQDNVLTTPPDITDVLDNYYYMSAGGGACVLDARLRLDGVDIIGNSAEDGGGAYLDGATIDIYSSAVMGNSADNGGGFQVDDSTLSLTNVLVTFNDATVQGGGISAEDAVVIGTNVTFGEDDAPEGGGLFLSGATTGIFTNTIFYGANTGEGVFVDSAASFTVAFSNNYGNVGGNYTGITDPTTTLGNISANPLFTSVTADGNVNNDDWSLRAGSPSDNAGDPAAASNDADASRNDQGAFGGPGSDWTY